MASDRSIVRGDLPRGWGLMLPDSAGRLRIVMRSLEWEEEQMDIDVVASLGRSIAKTREKELS